ncbi:autotransporter outer membrane beta-barrel domain-containing protein [Phaeospirillum tilakii]|uniref:Autotransporter domain-containing protein n=1 Tax=Phaeospirillum tilakii TaxID=741673 RepID=A0ABW5C609_9PROT
MRARALFLLATVSPLGLLATPAARADDGINRATEIVNGTSYSNNGANLAGATGDDGTGTGWGGDGTTVAVTGSGSHVTLTGGTITGGTGGVGATGADGGIGTTVHVESTADLTTVTIGHGTTVQGGTGGAGGAGGTGGAGFAIVVDGTNTTVDNSGTVLGGTSTTPYFGAAAIGGPNSTLYNRAGGVIDGRGGWGVGLAGTGVLLDNAGTIRTSGGNRAVLVTDPEVHGQPAAVVNQTTGSISGGDGQQTPTAAKAGSGIEVDDTVTGVAIIINRGTITGGAGGTGYLAGAAVDIRSAGTTTIDNYGTLAAGAAGDATLPRIALGLDQTLHGVSFINYGGSIDGGIATSQHGDLLNFLGGRLNGDIYGNAAGNSTGGGATVTFVTGTTTLAGSIGQAIGESVTVQGTTTYWGPVKEIVVANGATLAFDADSSLHAGALSFRNGGTLDLGTHQVHLYRYAGLGVSGTDSGAIGLRTTIDTTAGRHGTLVMTEIGGTASPLFASNAPTINPVVIGSVATGAQYIVIQDSNGRAVANLPSVVNGGGWRWSVASVGTAAGSTAADTDGFLFRNGASAAGDNTTNIVLTALGRNVAGTAGGSNGAAVQALAGYGGGNNGLLALSQAVNDLTAPADIQRAGAQLRPETTTNTAQAAMGAVTQAVNTIAARADAVRTAAAGYGTGIATGETPVGLGIWGQAFGATASQDKRAEIDGYDADTVGLAFGGDLKVIGPLRVGLSFAYARTNVDATGDRSGSGQEIDSYVTSLYSSYSARRWYLDTSLTYGYHQYDSTRAVTFAAGNAQSLTASYGGRQLGARAEAGVPLPLGRVLVTPLVSFAYNNLRQDGYTERGGAAALVVGSSSTDSLRSGLGAKLSSKAATIGNWEIRPNARAVWLHEFDGSAPTLTAGYVAGGSAFTTPGNDTATEHVDLGVGIDLASVRDITLSARYDADLADRYVGHSGSLQVRAEF